MLALANSDTVGANLEQPWHKANQCKQLRGLFPIRRPAVVQINCFPRERDESIKCRMASDDSSPGVGVEHASDGLDTSNSSLSLSPNNAVGFRLTHPGDPTMSASVM